MNETSKDKVVRLIKEASKPVRKLRARPRPAQSIVGDNNVQAGGDVHITTEKVVRKTIAKPQPGELHITEDQVARLHALKDEILKLEAAAKRDPATPQRVWSALNKKMGVGAMRMIPAAKFKAAEKYLLTWIGQLMDRPAAQKKAPDTVEKRRITYIQTNMKALDCEVRVRDYMEQHFGVRSLKELPTPAALERVYRYVASLK